MVLICWREYITWVSCTACKQINRSPEKLAAIYKYIFGSITLCESDEILRHWILAIENEDSRQAFNSWRLGKGKNAKAS